MGIIVKMTCPMMYLTYATSFATYTQQSSSAMPASSFSSIKSSAKPATSNSALHNQGIWSTMKHLMNQGQQNHTHSHGLHSVHQQVSHAHVYTLAGNPPNVVDLTASSQSTSNNKNKSKTSTTATKQRPWSKQSRALRNATIEDITAQGMIRASGGVNDIAGIGSTTSSLSLSSANSNNNVGFKRLWRGVQTMFVGCIPAHALYFGSYETIKSICTDQYHPHPHQQHHGDDSSNNTHKEGHVGHDTLSTTQAMLAGGVATLLHDFIMTPMDTMKQRMQLGHYDNLRHAFVSIVWGDGGMRNSATSTSSLTGAGEGWKGLYRSFSITVMTNVPYGMIMMTTNEWLRGVLEDGMYGTRTHHEGEVDNHPFHFGTILFSGMGAGMVASAATAPLDRIKTRLQTQRLGMVFPTAQSAASSSTATSGATAAPRASSSSAAIMEERALAAAMGEPKVCPKMAVQNAKRTLFPSSAASSMNTTISSIPQKAMSAATSAATPFKTVHYTTPMDAFQSIIQEEGIRGLFRGTLPRVALHAPSVAISWTAYEMAKDWLVWLQQQQH